MEFDRLHKFRGDEKSEELAKRSLLTVTSLVVQTL